MIEAMKQALEALEKSNRFVWHYAHSKATARIAEQCDEAITSLHQAIAELESQKQGEPVACKECHLKDTVYDLLGDLKVANLKLSVRSQRRWVGLTDEDDIDWEEGGNLKDLVKAIEAKLKQKNGFTEENT